MHVFNIYLILFGRAASVFICSLVFILVHGMWSSLLLLLLLLMRLMHKKLKGETTWGIASVINNVAQFYYRYSGGRRIKVQLGGKSLMLQCVWMCVCGCTC